MDKLFFGVKKSPTRKRKSPTRKRKSPVMCKSKLSLSKLRKLAVANGVSIVRNRSRLSKITGKPLKPKLVGCGTLMKRIKEAGLGHLLVTDKRKQALKFNKPLGLFTEDVIEPVESPFDVEEPPSDVEESPSDVEESPSDIEDDTEFKMVFGKSHSVPVAKINVKGRLRLLYRGKKGGLFYLKNKKPVYVNKMTYKKRKSPMRKRKSPMRKRKSPMRKRKSPMRKRK